MRSFGKNTRLNMFKLGNIPWNQGKTSWNKGKHLSEEHKEKLRQVNLKNPVRYWLGKVPFEGKEHPLWKGNKAGYSAIHHWIYRKLGRAIK